MPEAYDTYHKLYQNLIDAGFDDQTTAQCMLLIKDKKISKLISILSMHRGRLLDLVHTGQRQIDCLDFLIYKIKKEKEISQ